MRINANVSSEYSMLQEEEATRMKELMIEYKQICSQLAAQDDDIYLLQNRLAEKVLYSMKLLWQKTERESAITHNKELDRMHMELYRSFTNHEALLAKLKTEEYNVENLRQKLSIAEGSSFEKEKTIKKKNAEIENVRKEVERRVGHEKVELMNRLYDAKAAVRRNEKISAENTELKNRVAGLDREKMMLQKASKAHDEEARALKEGYDYFSNESRTLQTEKMILQAEYDELKQERDQLLKERESISNSSNTIQPVRTSSQVSSGTSAIGQRFTGL